MRPSGREKHVEPVLHPGCSVSRWARLLVLVLTPAFTACLQGPTASPDWIVEVQRGRYGGLCAGPDGGGGCKVDTTVHDDGRWSSTAFPEPETPTGSVPEGAATELASVLERGWEDLTAQPFTGTCPVAYDGQELIYVIRRRPRGPGAERADAAVQELRSCTFDLDTALARPWIETFEQRWRSSDCPSRSAWAWAPVLARRAPGGAGSQIYDSASGARESPS